MIPQKVTIYKIRDEDWLVNDVKTMQMPTLALYMDKVIARPDFSSVVVDRELWYVRTDEISKGENYAGKIDRSVRDSITI